MPRIPNPNKRLRGFSTNKKKLLDFVGYDNIKRFRRDNPEFNTSDAAYKSILGLYNQQVDTLNQQHRQQEQQYRKNVNSLVRKVNQYERKSSAEEKTIPLNINRLQDLNYLLSKLKIQGRKKYFKIGSIIYALNSNTIKRLEQVLFNKINGYVEVGLIATYSDGEVIRTYIEGQPASLHILPDIIAGTGLVEGGLFPYNHTLDLVDLKPYAIFHKNTSWGDERNENNCFITALATAGIDTTQAYEYIKNQFIPIKYLGEIATKLNIYITLKTLEGKKVLRKYGNPEHKHIPLGLIEKHYFLIQPTNYTYYCIKNYFNTIYGKTI